MERISVRVDESLKMALETAARMKGVRPSDIVRETLEAHFRDAGATESAYDLAERLGLVGCAAGMPADLSTNPAYFEGFGGG